VIIKASQRANGADLAVHLMNAADNERIEVGQVFGMVADDPSGAFAEFEFVARGTKMRQPIYSVSISPPQPMTRSQYFEAVDAIERRLGLTGQPRVVVFHVKNGREHCHAVWSRTDMERMRGIPLSHDHAKLMDVACELARKFGFELPKGLREWEEKRRQQKTVLEPTVAENAIEAATGVSPEQRLAEISAAFEASDSPEAFASALEERGYILARGDRRGFVVVDAEGNVHSLSRYVQGHSAKAIRQRLAPLTPEQLPSVDEARELMRRRLQAQQEHAREEQAAAARAADEAAAEEELRRQAQARRTAEEARLGGVQRGRRAKLAGKEQDLAMLHARERMSLHAAQKVESESLMFRLRHAVAEFIDRTPGLRSVLGPIQKMAGLDPADRHALERAALARRHARERKDIERRQRFLSRVEARERRAMERRLAKAEAQDRALAMEAARIAREEEQRQAEANRWAPMRSRPFEDGELSFTFNEEAADPNSPAESDGEGNAGPDHDDDEPAGPNHRRRRKRGRGYGR
jgi:hypothetical protein